MANTAEWAEEAGYTSLASALLFSALKLIREEEILTDYSAWKCWMQYAALLGRSEQWTLALSEARSCARHGDEHYPKDFLGRLYAHEALVLALRGAGEPEELEQELEVVLELARQVHAEGGPAPVSALLELATHKSALGSEEAETLFLEAWSHIEQGGDEYRDERQVVAAHLASYYEGAGTPEKAAPFVTPPAPGEETD